MPLSGEIDEIQVGELLQLLIQTQRRGVLTIETERKERRLLWLEVGQITLYLTGKDRAFRIGDLLVKTGTITENDLGKALRLQRLSEKRRVGEILIDLGIVTAEKIDEVLNRKFEEEIVEVFLIPAGRFVFHFDKTPEEFLSQEQVVSKVSLTTDNLMLTAMSQIDEWRRFTNELPSMKTIFVIRRDKVPLIHELVSDRVQKRQIKLINGRRSIEQLIQDTAISKFKMLSLVYLCFREGIVRALREDEAREIAAELIKKGDVSNALRQFDHVLELDPSCVGVRIDKFELLRTRRDVHDAVIEARKIAELEIRNERPEAAVDILSQAQALEPRNLKIHETLFEVLLEIDDHQRGWEVGKRLFKLYLRRSMQQEAREIIQCLLGWDPSHVGLRVALAEIIKTLEGENAAADELEKALHYAEEKGERSRAIDIMRRITRLDVDRTDMRDRLKKETIAEMSPARWSVRKMPVRTLILVAMVPVIIFLFLLLWNEKKARDALNDADEFFQGVESRQDIVSAISRFQQIVKNFEGTAAADMARRRLTEAKDRLTSLAEAGAGSEEGTVDIDNATPTDDLKAFWHYESLRKQGDLQGATDAGISFLRDHAASKLRDKILFPVLVTSTPSEGEIFVDGASHSTTPETLWLPAGRPCKLEVSHPGFSSQTRAYHGDGMVSFDFTLERTALWRIPLGANLRGDTRLYNSHWFLSTTEGRVFALDLSTLESREYPLGLFGQPSYLRKTGEALSMVAGRDILVLDANQERRFELEDAVIGPPGVVGNDLILTLAGGDMIRWSPDRGAEIWRKPGVGWPVGGMVSDPTTVVFAARGEYDVGELLGMDVLDGTMLWSKRLATEPCEVLLSLEKSWLLSTSSYLRRVTHGGSVAWDYPLAAPVSDLIGLRGPHASVCFRSGQELLLVDWESGERRWSKGPYPNIGAPLVSGQKIFVGAREELWCISLEGKVLWTIPLEGPSGPAPVIGSKVYVATRDGILTCVVP